MSNYPSNNYRATFLLVTGDTRTHDYWAKNDYEAYNHISSRLFYMNDPIPFEISHNHILMPGSIVEVYIEPIPASP